MTDKTLSVVLSALSFIGMIAMASCRGEDRGSGGEPSVTNSQGEPLGSDTHPDWSPDGTRIAFTSQRDGNYEIYAINADGSNLVRLTDHETDDWRPKWSPDGKRLAFSSERDGNWEISEAIDERSC